MPTVTYTPLANITLGSSAASVTFSSISQAYRDLVLVVTTLSSSATTLYMTLNSDSTATNYNSVTMSGNGTTATSASANNNIIFNISTIESLSIGQFMDYSATDKHKTVLARINRSDGSVYARASRWANTSAITSIALTTTAGTLSSGSTLALYGVAA